MYTIGDFARLGRVSVRMLRHYDAIGLLVPARVDPGNGYRRYTVDQLARLHRIVALKDLGFTLEEVGTMLSDAVSADELAGMLRLRRAELAAQMAQDASRLARVEARLRSIQEEGQTMTAEVVIKHVPAARVAQCSGVAESLNPQDITPVIKGLFESLMRQGAGAGLAMTGPGLARYEARDDERITVFAAAAVPATAQSGNGVDVVDLPEIERAATLLHLGSMDGCQPSYDALERWISEHGLRAVGLSREISLNCPPDDFDAWVTELQIEVADG
jgi:DNA-binding transcriptional MerR regulator